MTRPSCVPSSALLPRRGLPLGADPGDLHLGVALAVAHASPVAGLVLVMDDVDLGPGYLAQDLRGDLVMAKLARVADDLAIIDDKHGRQRHAGTNLTGKRVDGEDVVHRRLLLPATAAHDRVHRRTLSLLVRAQRAVPPGADHRHEEGLASSAPDPGTQPWIRPVRWHLRLSDPGGRRCLGRRLPVGAHRRVRRARLPGGGTPPAPAAERLARRAVPGRLRGCVLVGAMTGRGIWLARGGSFAAAGGSGITGAGCGGTGCGGAG